VKEVVERMKRQGIVWEKICANQEFDKGILFRKYQGLLKQAIKQEILQDTKTPVIE
jgi:hypothetical protein